MTGTWDMSAHHGCDVPLHQQGGNVGLCAGAPKLG